MRWRRRKNLKKVLIKYCPVWNGYDAKAQDVSKEILKSESGFIVEVKSGEKGEFTISYEGKVIFDKQEVERFPNDGEIVKLIKEV